MANTSVTLIHGTLPEGYCFTTLQQYYEDMFDSATAELPGSYTSFNFGSSLPDANDQDKPWIRTNSDGSLDRLYTYYSGYWVAPHAVPIDSDERRIWVGTEDAAGLWAYDGGDGTKAATEFTGAMWNVDTDFAFKFPVGVGTNATAYDGNAETALAIGDTGGEERHLLLSTESGVPAHTHAFPANNAVVSSAPVIGTGDPTPTNGPNTAANTPADSSLSHQNMPPYKAVYFIKRTVRKWYCIPTT